MADQSRAHQIEEKIRQKLAQLGEILDEWLNKRQLQPQSIPIPIDRPYHKKPNR